MSNKLTYNLGFILSILGTITLFILKNPFGVVTFLICLTMILVYVSREYPKY